MLEKVRAKDKLILKPIIEYYLSISKASLLIFPMVVMFSISSGLYSAIAKTAKNTPIITTKNITTISIFFLIFFSPFGFLFGYIAYSYVNFSNKTYYVIILPHEV